MRKKNRAIKEKKCGKIKGERKKKKQKSRVTVCYFADSVPSGAPQIDVFL